MTSYVKVIVINFILIICESFKNVHNYFKLKVKKIWIFMTQETYNTALGPINHLHKKGKVAFKSRGTLILLTFQELQANIQFNTSCRGKNVPIILQIISEGREATSTCEEVICCILQQCVMKNLLKKYYYQHWQKQNVISLSH